MASSPQTVLSLLNTLYASGFAIASPSTPLLKGRIMHTLYALTFLILCISSLANWIHTSFTLRTSVVSFPLKLWFVVTMVVIAVCGSILCSLLLMLCIENAFAERLHIAPYRSGFCVVVEAVSEWIQAFNCFRVGFLFMILHDTPVTILNFFFITSCRCAGPHVLPWTLLISTFISILSLIWRLVLLYFSYRRMLFYKNPVRLPPSHVYLTPFEHFILAVDVSDGGRLNEYDECWPVRASRVFVDRHFNCFPNCIQLIFHSVISTFLSIGMLFTCCIPCIHYYTCKKNSLMRRHKFSRSLVRKDIASNDTSIMHECKMLWENPGLGMGLKRKEAGIWQARFTLKHHTWLAVATRVRFPAEKMRIDFEITVMRVKDGKGYCVDAETNKWNAYTDDASSYRFPYFTACETNIDFVHTTLLFCQNYA